MSTPAKRPGTRAKPHGRGGSPAWLRARLSGARGALAGLGARAARALRALRDRVRRNPVPIEILVIDSARRRTLRREIRRVVHRVRRLVGQPLPTSIVVARQVLSAGRQLAGGTHVRQGDDGTRAALIRAALHVDGRDVTDDEVLAVIADQWIGLAMQYGGHSVLVPVEAPPAPKTGAPEPPPGTSPGRHTRNGSDPLVGGPADGGARGAWVRSSAARAWDAPHDTDSRLDARGRAA